MTTTMPHEEEYHVTTDANIDQQQMPYRPVEHFLHLYGGGGGKDNKQGGSGNYLPVAHRVYWFNQECPGNFKIKTKIIHHDPSKPITVDVERWTGPQGQRRKEVTQITKEGEVIVRATVIDYAHNKRATAHKYECRANFEDYLEKAETGAVGRALALLGYATLSAELDEGRIVDSPTEGGEGERGKNGGGGGRTTTPTAPQSPASQTLPDSALTRVLRIPGISKGVGGAAQAAQGGAAGAAPGPTKNNTATPSTGVATNAPPPPPPTSPPVPPTERELTLSEKKERIKDYELSVPLDVFSHFILGVCKQPAKRSEWEYVKIYEELVPWTANGGGEWQWRMGVTTPGLVEKLKKMSEAFPKASFAQFKTRLSFMNRKKEGQEEQDGGEGAGAQQQQKTFTECTTDEVLSVIEMMREISYLHDLGTAYDTFIDPATKARISFHHLKTTYNVDHPLDLLSPQTGKQEDTPVSDGRLRAYQHFLEEAYAAGKPDQLGEALTKRYATRLSEVHNGKAPESARVSA